MKKSQRLRLAALQAKDAATLTADERTELGNLVALAVAHPDASKDVDDSKLSASDYFTKFKALFQEKSDLALKNSAQAAQLTAVATFLGVKADALAAMTPEQLTAALAAKATGGTQAEANDAAVKAANGAKETAETNLATANTQLGVFATFLGVKADAMPKTGAEITTALSARIDLRAGQRLDEMGFPANGLPQSNKGDANGGDIGEVMIAYSKITDAQEAARFYAENIAPRIGQKKS